jgi:hypothetical protein
VEQAGRPVTISTPWATDDPPVAARFGVVSVAGEAVPGLRGGTPGRHGCEAAQGKTATMSPTAPCGSGSLRTDRSPWLPAAGSRPGGCPSLVEACLLRMARGSGSRPRRWCPLSSSCQPGGPAGRGVTAPSPAGGAVDRVRHRRSRVCGAEPAASGAGRAGSRPSAGCLGGVGVSSDDHGAWLFAAPELMAAIAAATVSVMVRTLMSWVVTNTLYTRSVAPASANGALA